MRGVAPLICDVGGTLIRKSWSADNRGSPPSLISTESAALPMESDRQGRAPRGPYFFFFLVAFFLATASPPSRGFHPIAHRRLLGMLETWQNSVKIKKQYLVAWSKLSPQM